MSVYTKITENDLSDYLEHYSIGKIITLTDVTNKKYTFDIKKCDID